MSDDEEDPRFDQAPTPEPMNAEEVQLIKQFKTMLQKVKAAIYTKTVHTTTDSEDLKQLQNYEVRIYSLGTQMLKILYGIETQPVPEELSAILQRKDLSSDALLLLENEVRNQCIQFPYLQKIM
jgi:hypothetical protein